jgi:hypothetical protein
MTLLHPESDLSLSLLAQGASVLRLLHAAGRPLVVDDLLDRHLRADRRRTPANFFSTLDVLYALGAIEREGYRIKLLQHDEHSRAETGDLFGGVDA